MNAAQLAAAVDLLPHTGDARLLTEVVSLAPEAIVARASIPLSHPLVSAGVAPAFLAIELGAQAAAVMEALSRASTASPAQPLQGALVRVRDATFSKFSLPVGEPIEVSAAIEGHAGPLAVYRLRVSVDGGLVAAAVISTMSQPAREAL